MTTLVAEANRIDIVPDNHGVMVVLDGTGDTKHIWDRNNPGEVATMRELYDSQVAKGMQAYSVDRKGNKQERIREFDPNAEKIIFAPALRGG
jgi:hypothetical protein